MKVFKIVTDWGSEWNGSYFATNGKVYYKKEAAQHVLDGGKCAFYARRFDEVWVQEYYLTRVEEKS